MTDYKQAYERLRATVAAYLAALDEPMSNEAAGRIQQSEIRLRTLLAQPLPLREVPSPSAKPDTLEKRWRCIEYLDDEILGAVDDLRRAHRFDPDAVSALLVLIEDAHVRQWTALKLAVKRVRASERKTKP